MPEAESKRPLYIPYAGPVLLEVPLLNKGSAFTARERREFNLEGLLPHCIETIEEQRDRAYLQFSELTSRMEKHIYLRSIQDTNETLYYSLLTHYLEEMLPLIYTPTVGEACQKFSQIYRRKRGLFINYEDRDKIDRILRNATRKRVSVIVVTDGERILGLGDQGIGGMGIPIGKLAIYSACGGISPANTLPITLDVGCDNERLINDPMYMGKRSPRIRGEAYFEFVDKFIKAIKDLWPNVLLQFEDFAQPNAMPLLKRYRDELCCFNDDIQGTAAVTAGTLLAACQRKGQALAEQRICFVGAGSAGCGIAEHLVAHMQAEGLSAEEAKSRIFMVDKDGLLSTDMTGLRDFQEELARDSAEVSEWRDDSGKIPLMKVIEHAKPTVLVGVSGQFGLFKESQIRLMAKQVSRPIILPLSNPTTLAEATPQDVIEWTQGEAIVATGSPFAPVAYKGRTYHVSQCNNSYIFPGIGLGVLASKAKRVTEGMLIAASRTLADSSPEVTSVGAPLLPALDEIRNLSRLIARRVAKQAMQDGVARERTDLALEKAIDKVYWEPQYRSYQRTSL
ncbi:NAD-dependent malic enzyme [Pelagicoccus sp. NFK12]|uniref:malate dehydrogenase (oxaloacetate-decarboxylating) n=1 Tax=Pelagicoccus enzymogenes TaxID=2773457 RepID=A0A927IJ72_9BACT|nr:NAD-dependent malic enzyme [Pelagicoccus enzymogenes]MBD5781559.1 NAD-dependent malic enzyme [Pelagicoccus enzymogenes]MDQ8200383.1 NAD-dependent malic enzyme [Pelagicoccus enzymogenes]